MRKFYCSWHMLFEGKGSLKIILQKIRVSNWKPEIIIGIARGGLIVAVAIAHQLGIKWVLSTGIKSYEGEIKGLVEVYQEPDFATISKDVNILVVDDIADSGETLKFLADYLQKKGFRKVKFATLFWKKKSKFVPDFFIPIPEDVWIVFPWE